MSDPILAALSRVALVDGIYVRTGGLLHCCLATIREASRDECRLPPEGEVLECEHCGEHMRVRSGVWEWFDTHPRSRRKGASNA